MALRRSVYVDPLEEAAGKSAAATDLFTKAADALSDANAILDGVVYEAEAAIRSAQDRINTARSAEAQNSALAAKLRDFVSV